MVHRALILLKKIKKGKVTTYGELARMTRGSPRAIGQVMKNNKNPKLYPCYKVVMSDGRIGGYNGSDKGNIKKKIRLLRKDSIEIKNGKINLKKYGYVFR